MPARLITVEDSVGARRGEAVICVPRVPGRAQLTPCLESLIGHTPAEVPLVVCDGDPAHEGDFSEMLERRGFDTGRLLHLGIPVEAGVACMIDRAVAAAAPADVVIVDPGCIVAEGWLEGLRSAAYADTTIATAATMTTRDLGLARADAGASLEKFERAAAAVRARSKQVHPRVARPGRNCVYVRREAIDLVEELGSGWEANAGESDFFVRCLQRGLSHVIADEVLISSPDPSAAPADGGEAPLARSLSAARRATSLLSLVIDARILDGRLTGTQVHVMELIAAIARTRQARIRAIVPTTLDAETGRALMGLPGIELVRAREILRIAPGEVVHRPFQVSGADDLTFLVRLGERLVVTHHDLIGYRNPSYFSSGREWRGYRRLTRRALAVADHAVFLSAHALRDALAEDLVDAGRATVVPNGVDHPLQRAGHAAVRPPVAVRLPDQGDMILCLGTDLHHKNRVFALRVLDQLQQPYGWDGYLVFAGPHLHQGSSVDEEARLLARSPRLAERTIDAGAVDEGEKLWLLRRAGLVLYPTGYEGFGLVPFEAAEQGVPCMWAPVASLAELLPVAEAMIVPWDARATADRAARLLTDRAAATSSAEVVRAAGAALTWDATAERLIEVYQETCDQPASAAGSLERIEREGAVSEDALRLVGPDGALVPELERPLLALATHPRIGRPLLGAIKAGYRASHFVRRLARPGERRSD